MKCLVTGATGFIGRSLCRLLLDHRHDLIALSRNGGGIPGLESTIALDLSTQQPSKRVLKGVGVVFHLAGIAHRRAPAADYEALNHQAVLKLARGAEAAGARCFVFLSSVKAMGPATDHGVRCESDVFPAQDAYGLSKWQAECDLSREFSHSPMSVVILRPALVYGPGARGNLQLLATAVRRGLPRPPEWGQRSMVAVEDLVELMLALAEQPPAGVNTWIVTDGQAYSTRQIYDLLREAQGMKAARAWLPGWAWRSAASLVDGLRAGDASVYQRLFGTELYSSGALREALGWCPRRQLDRAAVTRMLESP